AFRIGKIFGWGYAMRRLGLAFFSTAGAFGARFAADHAKKTFYYKLKHGIYEKKQAKTASAVYHLLRQPTQKNLNTDLSITQSGFWPKQNLSEQGMQDQIAETNRDNASPILITEIEYDNTLLKWEKEQLIS
ncbi:MAG: hypothetical protein LIO96_02345, partial [Lachnospiraceae bacterium]|nr:hypothetical protein [Lachnospiraceae bacterium]